MATQSKFFADLGIKSATNTEIDGNLSVSGNLTVSGTQTTIDSTTKSVADSMIELASGNTTADLTDIGIYGNYNDGLSGESGVSEYTGLFRDATDSTWKLYDGLEVEPTTTVNTSGSGYTLADLQVGDLTATTLTATNTLTGGSMTYPTSDGTDGQVLKTNGSGTLSFGDAASTDGITTSGSNTIIQSPDDTNVIHVNNSANIGIGTSISNHKVNIHTNDDDDYALRIEGSTNNSAVWTGIGLAGEESNTKAAIIFKDIGQSYSRGDLIFAVNNDTDQTNASPSDARMVIKHNGNVLIGTTSDTLSGTDAGFVFQGDGNASFVTSTGILYMRRTGSDSVHMKFRSTTNATVGQISSDGSNTTYSTSSDYRLKENVIYDWDATTRLKQLRPARFNFLQGNTETQDGFLAHEVQTIVPTAVEGIKDAVDENGDVDPQSIDHSQLVPLLVKTIQELEARIATLES